MGGCPIEEIKKYYEAFGDCIEDFVADFQKKYPKQ
jgi:hypothetical protein